MMATCAACGYASECKVHRATERMFGLGGTYEYLECGRCGSLSLENVPASLADFYPPDYHSSLLGGDGHADSPLVRLVRPTVTRFRLWSRRFGAVAMRAGSVLGFKFEEWTVLLDGLRLSLDAGVLDVGCGPGERLQALRRNGFRNLTGIDSYIPDDRVGDGIRFVRGTPHDLPGSFDVVMLHHSLEHMPDPASVFEDLHRLVAPNGFLIIRVPLSGKFAWRIYGTEWVQLDAPRHLFLYTAAGLEALAARAGFQVDRVVYDSGAFQFWGSEQYRRGIPLRGPHGSAEPSVLFSPEELKEFDRRARSLNQAGDGDQAAFLLRKSAMPATNGKLRQVQ